MISPFPPAIGPVSPLKGSYRVSPTERAETPPVEPFQTPGPLPSGETMLLHFAGKKYKKPGSPQPKKVDPASLLFTKPKTIFLGDHPSAEAAEELGNLASTILNETKLIEKLKARIQQQPANSLVCWQQFIDAGFPEETVQDVFDDLYKEGRLVPFPEREGPWRVLDPNKLTVLEAVNSFRIKKADETRRRVGQEVVGKNSQLSKNLQGPAVEAQKDLDQDAAGLDLLLEASYESGLLDENFPLPSLRYFQLIPEIGKIFSESTRDQLLLDRKIKLHGDGTYRFVPTGTHGLTNAIHEALITHSPGDQISETDILVPAIREWIERGKLSLDQVRSGGRETQWEFLVKEGYLQKRGQSYVFTDKVLAYQQTQTLISKFLHSPSQFTFRIVEPKDPSQKWRIEYGFTFHSEHDPAGILMVPQGNYRYFQNALYLINKDLGLRMEKAVEDALKNARPLFPQLSQQHYPGIPPAPIELTTQELSQFLETIAPQLKEHGFGIMEPECFTQGKMPKLKLQAMVPENAFQVNQGIGADLNSTAKLNWLVAYLDGKQMTLQDLLKIAENPSPLQFIKGKWVLVDLPQMRAAAALLREPKKQTLGNLVRLANQHHGIEIDVPKQLAQRVEKLREHTALKFIDAPQQFQGTLKDFQKRGLSWLNFMTGQDVGCILADDRGLGKTVQALALIALKRERTKPEAQKPTLVACPFALLTTWKESIQKFTPHLQFQEKVVTLDQFRKLSKEKQQQVPVVLVNYETLRGTSAAEFVKNYTWSGVVLDEAQKIKNGGTETAKATQDLKADYRVAITGTPVENHVGEIWSIMNFLNPGLLGTEEDFKKRYLTPIQQKHDPIALQELQDTVNPFILRRSKTDPALKLDIPPKTETVQYCEPSQSQQDVEALAYGIYLSKASIENGMKIDNIRTLMIKLKQICDHPDLPLYYEKNGVPLAGPETRPSPKMQLMKADLDTILAKGEKAVIFTEFREMTDILKAFIEKTYGRPVLVLKGGMKEHEIKALLASFNSTEPTSPPILISTYKTGGEGLNLQVANHVIEYDLGWNPASLRQAEDRTHRIGQTKPVTVHRYITRGSIEEKILELLMKKERLCQAFLPEGDAKLDGLTNDELLQVFESVRARQPQATT